MKLYNFFGEWFNYFRPSLFLSSISEINIDSLVANKIKLVIIDLDNTLVPHFSMRPTKLALDFIKKLKEQNLIVVIASNNTKKRVLRFCDALPKIDDVLWNSNKPFSFKVKKILKKFNIYCEETIIIGDQFITDIWLANNLKTWSILVTSLFSVNTNSVVSKKGIKYFVENYIYKHLQRKNLINKTDLSKIIIGTNDEIL